MVIAVQKDGGGDRDDHKRLEQNRRTQRGNDHGIGKGEQQESKFAEQSVGVEVLPHATQTRAAAIGAVTLARAVALPILLTHKRHAVSTHNVVCIS